MLLRRLFPSRKTCVSFWPERKIVAVLEVALQNDFIGEDISVSRLFKEAI